MFPDSLAFNGEQDENSFKHKIEKIEVSFKVGWLFFNQRVNVSMLLQLLIKQYPFFSSPFLSPHCPSVINN